MSVNRKECNLKDHLYIDIETFSKVDIKSAGTVKYCENCEVMLVGFKLNGKFDYYDFSSKTTVPQWAIDHVASGGKVVAHNALFEHVALNTNFPLIPEIQLTQMVDTMALCAAAGLPLALGKATAALGLDVQKYDGGGRLITKFCIPRKPSKLQKHIRNMPEDNVDDWVEFRDIYLKADVESMEEMHDLLPPLVASEQVVWEDTMIVNLLGIPVDSKTNSLIISKLAPMIDEEATEYIRIAGHYPTQRNVALGWVRDQGVQILDMKADTIAKVLEDPESPAHVVKALKHRANTTHACFKKFDVIDRALSADGTIKGTLQYHAAGTGRFGGRLLQPQNLVKGNVDGEEAVARIQAGEFNVELVKSAVRPMIYHPDGLTIVDYASIEAMVVQFVCQDKDALEVFRSGGDPYKVMGSKIYGVPVEGVTDKQRFVGKQAILGLGYQMSAKKFIMMVEAYGETISKPDASKAVDVYRRTHKKLVGFWKNMDGAALMAIQRPGDTIMINKYVSFEFNHPYLEMKLPSGRSIRYFQPDVVQGNYGLSLTYMSMNDRHQYVRTHTYGGKLTENLVQAIARDILVVAIRALIEEGHRIITHVHDEIIVSGHHLSKIEEIMCRVPEWCEGLPLRAEGAETARYKKI